MTRPITSPDRASRCCASVSDSLLGLQRWPVMFVGGFESSQHHFPARRRVGLGPVAAAARGNGAPALGRQKVRHQRAVGGTGTRKLFLRVFRTRHWVFWLPANQGQKRDTRDGRPPRRCDMCMQIDMQIKNTPLGKLGLPAVPPAGSGGATAPGTAASTRRTTSRTTLLASSPRRSSRTRGTSWRRSRCSRPASTARRRPPRRPTLPSERVAYSPHFAEPCRLRAAHASCV